MGRRGSRRMIVGRWGGQFRRPRRGRRLPRNRRLVGFSWVRRLFCCFVVIVIVYQWSFPVLVRIRYIFIGFPPSNLLTFSSLRHYALIYLNGETQ